MIAETEISQYIGSLGAKTSTPGGGAAAALTGAQAIALIEMVSQFTTGDVPEIASIIERAQRLTPTMLALGDDDANCFKALMATYTLPKSTEDEKSQRTKSIQLCLEAAATVPLNVIKTITGVIPDIVYLADHGNRNLITDVAIAASLGQSALTSSKLNVLINLKHTRNENFRGAALEIIDSIPASLRQLQNVIDEISAQLH